jgi:hypothetical protein
MQFGFPPGFPFAHPFQPPPRAQPQSTTPEKPFPLPSFVPEEGWKEYNHLVDKGFPEVLHFIKERELDYMVVTMKGVESLDIIKYDPNSKVLGLWFDTNSVLRGVCPIHEIKS